MAAPIPDDVHAALVEHLRTHSVREGDFTLKSGRRSSWFIDSKQTACEPDGIVLMAEAALAVLPDDATAIGGLTVGADPVAYAVAAVAATKGRKLRSFTIRKEAKDHGVTGRIAGPLRPGSGQWPDSTARSRPSRATATSRAAAGRRPHSRWQAISSASTAATPTPSAKGTATSASRNQ